MLRLGLLVRKPPRRAADGFTLIELVISVAILGIVMTAFAAIISTSLLVSGQTERRLDSSNALRRIGVTFTTDVASSLEAKLNEQAACGGGIALIELRGLTFDDPPVTPPDKPQQFKTAVAYVYADGVLTRRVCRDEVADEGSTSAATTVVGSAELVTGLGAALSACIPDCANPNATYSLVLTPSGGTAQKLSATRRAP